MKQNEEEKEDSDRIKERKRVLQRWGQALSKSQLAILEGCSVRDIRKMLKSPKISQDLKDLNIGKYDRLIPASIIAKYFRPGYCNRNRTDNP